MSKSRQGYLFTAEDIGGGYECDGFMIIYRPYFTTRNGRRIYRKNGGMFRLKIKLPKVA